MRGKISTLQIYGVFMTGLLFLTAVFPSTCFAGGSEKQSDEVWKETFRPPRENFTPETGQKLFDLSKSILNNPILSVETPGKPPKSWYGSLRIWKDVYKSPDCFSRMVTVEQDAEKPFQNRPSVKIKIAPSEEDVYLELGQEISMKNRDLKGKKIRLSFYAYRENPPTGKEFFITGIMFDREKAVIGTTVDIHPNIMPGKWLYFSQEGVVKPETEIFKFSLRFISGGNDTVWLSGFLLEEIQ